jgi:LCP family protein required for cell wall assembly
VSDQLQPPGRPLPPRLDPRGGRGPGREEVGGRPRRGLRGTGVVRAACAVLSVLLLAGTGWGWHLARVAQASLHRTDAIPGTGNSDARGGAHARRETNLLLVGRDSRAGLTAAQQAQYSTGHQQGLLDTDTMILVHVPADGSGASFVSLPRDLYVAIPGHGKGKLNAAYADGYRVAAGSDADRDAAGARLLIQAVSGVTGLQVDHFAEVNLLGFIDLSTIVGGVQVNLCAATHDPDSGANFPAGVQTITGADALKFVRQRHGLPSEIDRQVRQQVYIAGLLRNVLSQKLLLDLGAQQKILRQLGSSITVDDGLDLLDLAAQMQGVQLGRITFQTLPGLTDARVSGWGAVLVPPSAAALDAFFSGLAAPAGAGGSPARTAAPAVPPSSVTVQVANGSGVPGAAATAARALAAAGFPASADGNAARTATTSVRHHPGDDARAVAVAGSVPGAAVVADGSVPAGTVRLVLGTDFHRIGAAVATPTSSAAAGTYAQSRRTAADTSCIH